MRHIVLLCLFSTIATAAVAQSVNSPAVTMDVAAARTSLVGEWAGDLEYRDYSADKWFGIPVKTRITDQGDQATIIRTSDFDDGPKVGNVRIVTVELFDATASKLQTGSFRKGRAAEIMTYSVMLAPASRDSLHWTMIEETQGKDDDRPATLRLTTIRAGDRLETLKEVDFLDDDKNEWLVRNRTRLTRTGD